MSAPRRPERRSPRSLAVAGERLLAPEARFFAAANPLGFILFRRNCSTPDQVGTLVASLRDCLRASRRAGPDRPGGRPGGAARAARLAPLSGRRRDRGTARSAGATGGAARCPADRRRPRTARHFRRLPAGARSAGIRGRSGDRRPRLRLRPRPGRGSRPGGLRRPSRRRRAAGLEAYPWSRARPRRQPSRPADRRDPPSAVVGHRFCAVSRLGPDALGDDRPYYLHDHRSHRPGDVVAAGHRRGDPQGDRVRRRARFRRSVDAGAGGQPRRAGAAGARRRLRPGAALQRRPCRDGGDCCRGAAAHRRGGGAARPRRGAARARPRLSTGRKRSAASIL